MALDILQGNCRGLAVDLDEGAFISEQLLAGCPYAQEDDGERKPDFALADQRDTTTDVFAHRGSSATRVMRWGGVLMM